MGWIEEPTVAAYTLDAGDQLRIIVADEPQLSGEFTVDASGSISIPTLDRIQARERTPADLEAAIRQELAPQMRDPQVAVQITTMRSVFILGEVARPGSYPFVPDMSVLTAVATAGGFTPRANTSEVTIVRRTDGRKTERRARRNSVVLPGDVIYVRESLI